MRSNPTWVLTAATIKMWFRDRTAMFWNFVIPIIIMAIFGVLNFGSFSSVDVGVVDLADNETSRGLVQGLEDVEALDLSQGASLEGERQALLDGDRELVLVLPDGFGVSGETSELRLLYNEGRPQEVEVGRAIINELLHEMTLAAAGVERPFTLTSEPITNRDFSYIDFLLPGIIAMSIMQMGMFSVAFSFVQLKRLGILRRLFATPVRPASILFAQVVTRLIVSAVQTVLLIGIAVLFFDAEIVGNIAAILVMAIIGGGVFLTIGFGVAGWAKNENVAAPVANVIAMPMMFLSGVFFGREFLPEILQTITAYLPLTYLVEGMRNISADGATLWSQGENLLGLGVWLLLSFIVATRLFRWE
ncbi:MAG: ABC transporter permease [Chloroflexi bacterium]|nr:ABC transporter permease [Chloroflexota bacterium]